MTIKTVLTSKQFKSPLVIFGVIVAGAIIGITIVLVLTTVGTVNKDSPSTAEMRLTNIKSSAAIAESTGDTDKALVYYRQALANYVAHGNKDGIADITAKITQLEKWKLEQNIAKEQSFAETKKRAAESGNAPLIPDDPALREQK